MDRIVIAISEDDFFEMGEHDMANCFGVTVHDIKLAIENNTPLSKGIKQYYFNYLFC